VSSNDKPIPLYSADGRCVGWRSREAAEKMVAAGFWKPSHGRKGHLKAVWLGRDDGSSPVETNARAGTRYSFLQKLESGRRCWKLRPVSGRDDDGESVTTRGVFLQVVADCLVG
jgi:hypothetical protein